MTQIVSMSVYLVTSLRKNDIVKIKLLKLN